MVDIEAKLGRREIEIVVSIMKKYLIEKNNTFRPFIKVPISLTTEKFNEILKEPKDETLFKDVSRISTSWPKPFPPNVIIPKRKICADCGTSVCWFCKKCNNNLTCEIAECKGHGDKLQ